MEKRPLPPQNIVVALVLRVTLERISGLLEELDEDPESRIVYKRVCTGGHKFIVTEVPDGHPTHA